MATCVVFETTTGPTNRGSPSLSTIATWKVADGVLSAGEWSCPAGTHLVMTIAEVNAMPKAGIPDAALMKETFFLSFGLVMACYLMGKFTGAVLQLIRGDKKDDL
jgi:acetoacetate decarboxylase